MPEKVLPLDLSGEEIRVAILDTLGRRLAKDGYLNPNMAYQMFSAKITVHIECHDLGRVAEVNVTEQVTQGEIPEGENPDEYLDKADAEFTMEQKAPNDVRVETGQVVPVLTKQADGKPVVRGIRYGRNAAKKGV